METLTQTHYQSAKYFIVGAQMPRSPIVEEILMTCVTPKHSLSPCMYIKLQFRAIQVLKSWLVYWHAGPHHSKHLRKDIER
jgi:hypothetical protein